MWVKFASDFEDLFFYEHFIDDFFANAVPYLFNLRGLFNVYFRDGRFEPIGRKVREMKVLFTSSKDRKALLQHVTLSPITYALLPLQEKLLLRIQELFL